MAFDNESVATQETTAPKRSRRSARGASASSPRRTVLMGLIVAFFLIIVVAAIALAYQVDTFLATDARFTLVAMQQDGEMVAGGPLEVVGVTYTNREEILRVFDQDVGRSLYLLPLSERRNDLLGIDWVEDASITRVWPNRLRVAIRERTPVAVAVFSGNRPGDPLKHMLVDRSGEMMLPPKQATFDLPVIFGLHPGQPEEFRISRMELFERLQQEVTPLNARFSELFLNDPRNVRATLVMDGRNLTLMLGNEKYLTRVQNFLNNYEAVIKEDPRANLFDMRLEDRIVARREGLSGA